MNKPLSPTALRKNLFKVLDQIIATGVPVEIGRSGHTLKLILEEKPSRLSALSGFTIDGLIDGNPEELTGLQVGKWSEGKNL